MGDSLYGGLIPSEIQNKLKDITDIKCYKRAFGIILSDRSVVVWGDGSFGGNTSAINHLLREVIDLQSCYDGTFIALNRNGKAISWGIINEVTDYINRILISNFTSYILLKQEAFEFVNKLYLVQNDFVSNTFVLPNESEISYDLGEYIDPYSLTPSFKVRADLTMIQVIQLQIYLH